MQIQQEVKEEKRTLWLAPHEYRELVGKRCPEAQREYVSDLVGDVGEVNVREHPGLILSRVVVEAQA